MARKRTRRVGLTSGKGSHHGARKSRTSSIISRRDTSHKTSRNLPARSQEARARAFHVLSDLRRDPSKTLSQAASDREDCATSRSEEHTSELQSLTNLVCRLLLEKK